MAFKEFSWATSAESLSLMSNEPSLTSTPDFTGTFTTNPPTSVLRSTPRNARTLPTLFMRGCHSCFSITVVVTVAGGIPIPAINRLNMNVFNWLNPKIRPNKINTPTSITIMRRFKGGICIKAAYALVFLKRSRGRKRAPIQANGAQISLRVFSVRSVFFIHAMN